MNADLDWFKLQCTTKHISKKLFAIPSSWHSPLVFAGKIAISVCSFILHCQKYHFLGRWHCACCPRARQLETTYSVQVTALWSTDDDDDDCQWLPTEFRNQLSFLKWLLTQARTSLNVWYSWPRVFLLGASGCSGTFFTQLLFHNASSGKIFWC